MHLTETLDDAVLILSPRGRLDGVTSAAVSARVEALVRAGHRLVVFDGEHLEFVSSAGLRVFILAGKQLRAAGGKLVLAALTGPVREVFDLSGFSSLFPVHADRAAAVAALKG